MWNVQRVVPAHEHTRSHWSDRHLSLTEVAAVGTTGDTVGPGHHSIFRQQWKVHRSTTVGYYIRSYIFNFRSVFSLQRWRLLQRAAKQLPFSSDVIFHSIVIIKNIYKFAQRKPPNSIKQYKNHPQAPHLQNLKVASHTYLLRHMYDSPLWSQETCLHQIG